MNPIVGGLVRLKSGGPPMTITLALDEGSSVIVRWFDADAHFNAWTIPTAALDEVRLEPDVRPAWQREVLARLDRIEQEQKLHVQSLDKAHDDVREVADTVRVLCDQVNIRPPQDRKPPAPPQLGRVRALTEVLGEIEGAALAATGGRWHNPIEPEEGWGYGAVVSDKPPHLEGYGGNLIAESFGSADAAYVVASQPLVVIALVAKLREALGIIGGLRDETNSNADYELLERRCERLFGIEVP